MTYLHHIGLFALIALLSVAMSMPAATQPGANEPREERVQDFLELLNKSQTKLHLIALQQERAKQKKVHGRDGVEPNLVLAARRLRPRGAAPDSEPTAPEPSPDAFDCINPPSERRGRYVAAYLNVQPLVQPAAPNQDRLDFDESTFVSRVSDTLMPEKLREGQPGVAIVINRGDGDWAFELDEAWQSKRAAHRWLEPLLEGEVDQDNAVCKISRAVEDLLERTRDHSIDDLLQQRRLRQTFDAVTAEYEFLRDRVEDEVADTHLYRTKLRPELEAAQAQLERAEEAMERANYRAASEAIESVGSHVGEVDSTFTPMLELQLKAARMKRRIQTIRESTSLRRHAMVPHGKELDEKLQTCATRQHDFENLVRAGEPLDESRIAREHAEACIESFVELRSSTEKPFNIMVVYVPIGATGGLILIVLIFLASRFGRSQTLRYEVTPTLAEWSERVPIFVRRLERMKRKSPEIFDSGEAAARDTGLTPREIDTIDRAFVIAARAGEILSKATQLNMDASTHRIGPLEECLALLTEQSTEFTPTNTADKTPIRRGLRETETIEHSDLLDTADTLTDRVVSILETSDVDDDSQQGGW